MSLEDRPPFAPAPAARPARPPALQGRPWVSWGITAACIAVYLFEAWLSGDINHPDNLGALNAPLVRSGQWWRMATCIVEHGNLVHIALNLSVVLQLGTTSERLLGRANFATISLITAFGSSALALLLSSPESSTVGASGMIVGWAGALMPIATDQFRRSLRTWVLQVALLSLIPHISWQGHLGGFVAGLICGYYFRLTASRA